MENINVLYLLKILDTNKLSELVANLDVPSLDINLSLWSAIDSGEIEVDEKKDRVKALKEAVPSSDIELAGKLMRVIRHYAKNGANVTRGRLNNYAKDPMDPTRGYPWHEYQMALQHLIDNGEVVEEVCKIPKTDKRPYRVLVFLGLPENDNAAMNEKSVEKWIADFENTKVK